MPSDIGIRSDGVMEQFVKNANAAPKWMPRVIEHGLTYLGKQIAVKMQQEVRKHRYTGALEDSITSEYTPNRVEIGPTAKRGKFDAGVILELGTKPIPNLPWSPIKKWADFRGIEAFPVWYSIREKGVQAHPFLKRTLVASEGLIEIAAGDIALQGANQIVQTAGIV